MEDADSTEHRFDEEQLAAIERQYAPTDPNLPRRIHIIGLGSIGKLVAHALRGIPDPPPITLIFHRRGWETAWEESKKQITVQDGGQDIPRSGYDYELLPAIRRRHGVTLEEGQADVYDVGNTRPDVAAQMLKTEESKSREAASRDRQGVDEENQADDLIDHLIVTTKAAVTVSALLSLKPRLSKDTTIAFLQNGMGIIDEVNEKVFPDEETRPNYIQGVVSHGANVPPDVAERDPFYVVHAGHGTIGLGLLPRRSVKKTRLTADGQGAAKDLQDEQWAPGPRYLLRTIVRTPALCAVGFTLSELLQQQLEKLAVNSVLNPLTALIDARNGYLTHNFPLTRTMRLMLAETSLVIRSLPELQALPNVNQRFSPEQLEMLCVKVARATAENVSSTLADVRAGRRTELEYINGYIVDRGEELGIKCVVNYAIMQAVIGKALMVQRETQDDVPLEREKRPEKH